jgi:hypothetical protein
VAPSWFCPYLRAIAFGWNKSRIIIGSSLHKSTFSGKWLDLSQMLVPFRWLVSARRFAWSSILNCIGSGRVTKQNCGRLSALTRRHLEAEFPLNAAAAKIPIAGPNRPPSPPPTQTCIEAYM